MNEYMITTIADIASSIRLIASGENKKILTKIAEDYDLPENLIFAVPNDRDVFQMNAVRTVIGIEVIILPEMKDDESSSAKLPELPKWLYPEEDEMGCFNFLKMESVDRDDILDEYINNIDFDEAAKGVIRDLVVNYVFPKRMTYIEAVREGKVKNFNANDFAEEVISFYKLAAFGSNLYQYNNGIYIPLEGCKKNIYAPATNGFTKLKNMILKDLKCRLSDVMLDNVCKAVKSFAYVDSANRVQEPDVLNMNNGTYNTKTHEFAPYDEKDLTEYNTVRIPITYNKDITSHKAAEDFFGKIFEGDAELIKAAYMIIGYSFLRNLKGQRFFFLYGKAGCGKSTFAKMIIRMFGRYNVSAVSVDTMVKNRFAKVSMVDKMVNIVHETNSMVCLDNASEIKKLSNGEVDYIEHKGIDGDSDNDIFATQIHCINDPVSCSDPAFWERIMVVPFNHKFRHTNEEISEETLLESICDEDGLSFLFNKAMEGLKQWQANGGSPSSFIECEAMKEAADEFRGNPLQNWMTDDNINADTVVGVEVKNVVNKCKSWCFSNKKNFPGQSSVEGIIESACNVVVRRRIDKETGKKLPKMFYLKEDI